MEQPSPPATQAMDAARIAVLQQLLAGLIVDQGSAALSSASERLMLMQSKLPANSSMGDAVMEMAELFLSLVPRSGDAEDPPTGP